MLIRLLTQKVISTYKLIKRKKRGSPFIEEGILIVFGLFVFLIILSSINQILDWFINFSGSLFDDLKGKLPLGYQIDRIMIRFQILTLLMFS